MLPLPSSNGRIYFHIYAKQSTLIIEYCNANEMQIMFSVAWHGFEKEQSNGTKNLLQGPNCAPSRIRMDERASDAKLIFLVLVLPSATTTTPGADSGPTTDLGLWAWSWMVLGRRFSCCPFHQILHPLVEPARNRVRPATNSSGQGTEGISKLHRSDSCLWVREATDPQTQSLAFDLKFAQLHRELARKRLSCAEMQQRMVFWEIPIEAPREGDPGV